jgi:tRNA (guanine37-N1)-methyltransferase
MLIFDILTIFPKIFEGFLKESFIKKAKEKNLIKIRIWDLRDFTTNKRKTVDDRPFGGGLGMVLKIEPIFRAIKKIEKTTKTKKKERKVILFTPRGKQFNQKIAFNLSKLKHLILICGRYEGVDERVAKYLSDLQLSIGPYDLMGGEIPAMVIIETVTRLIPGVLGKSELLKERVTKKKGFVEYVQYTRPAIFSPQKGVYWKVPKVLLSGNHEKVRKWREKHKKVIE